MTTKDRRIHYLSLVEVGKTHDYEILKQIFAPHQDWFADKVVRLDSGFQGFDKLYPTVQTYLPHKRKRVKTGQDNALTEEQKIENKTQAGQRIYVEHSIGGIKRYRILHNQLRVKSTYHINIILGVCAGLWNFLIH